VTATSIVVSCLTDDVVLALAQGHISRDGLPPIEAHLHVCPDCRSVVAETAKFLHEQDGAEPLDGLTTHMPGRPAPRPLALGTLVSRYVVTDVLGVGGAGVVYRAHDPQLRRNIALKLLRPEHSGAHDTGGARRGAALEARLLREARAMARLSHPNVVTVFDVGLFDGQIFLVMELVEGETLDGWLTRPHSLHERIAMFIEAGRGLAAAHAEQIAHRDFKPANVLVGTDGRVRVTDFGLARPWTPGAEVEREVASEALQTGRQFKTGQALAGSRAEPRASTRRDLTYATATEGALAGTPAFMAPEQFLRTATDARTDQFSFCVALYRAAYGQWPFPGRNIDELSASVTAGQLAPPPAGTDVPPQLFVILRRGLSVEPGARHASMADLLAELGGLFARSTPTEPIVVRRLRGLVLSAATLCALVMAAWLVALVRPGRPALLPVAPGLPEAPRAELAPLTPEAASVPPGAAASAPRARRPEAARVAKLSRPVRARPSAARPRPKPRREPATITPKGERFDDRLKDPF
jgi:serine/threonine protein kinase